MTKVTRLCDIGGCERKHAAKGMCYYHYRKANPPAKNKPVTCPHCGAVTLRRDPTRPDAKVATGFCSLLCRDMWRIETGNNPEPSIKGKPRQVSQLPSDHPVRILMRTRMKSPIRTAFESEDWAGLIVAIEEHVVKVDGCWLWARQADRYARVFIGKREHRVHRLAKSAADGSWVPSHLPVHHVCAETLCVNPAHLQVVQPHENTAEMMERRFYVNRIAELEAALAAIDLDHPSLAMRRTA